MINKHKILFSFLFLILFGCASQKAGLFKPQPDVNLAWERNTMVGKWYGKIDVKEGGSREWLREARNDGTFTVKFKYIQNDGKIFEQVEAGYWGLSHGIYFTMTREVLHEKEFQQVNVTDPVYYDAYQIEKLDQKNFRYKSLETGILYEAKKVSNAFTI